MDKIRSSSVFVMCFVNLVGFTRRSLDNTPTQQLKFNTLSLDFIRRCVTQNQMVLPIGFVFHHDQWQQLLPFLSISSLALDQEQPRP